MNVENYLEEQKVGAHLGSVSGPSLPTPLGEIMRVTDGSPILLYRYCLLFAFKFNFRNTNSTHRLFSFTHPCPSCLLLRIHVRAERFLICAGMRWLVLARGRRIYLHYL